MSMWGKIAQGALIGAAPFTGGASLAFVPAAGMIGGAVDAHNASKAQQVMNATTQAGQALAQFGRDAQGNPINAPTNAAYAAQEQALANNRAREAELGQRGVVADTSAMRNMFRAGAVSRMNPNALPINLSGTNLMLPNLAPTEAGQKFANLLQENYNKAAATGQPTTLNGLPQAGPEELQARAKALDAAGIGTGMNSGITGVVNKINQGIGLANLGKGVWDGVTGAVKPAINTAQPAPPPAPVYYDTSDNSDGFGEN